MSGFFIDYIFNKFNIRSKIFCTEESIRHDVHFTRINKQSVRSVIICITNPIPIMLNGFLLKANII